MHPPNPPLPCTQPPSPSKRVRRKDARPGELLAAALDLFVEKGFAATRAEEVARRAGVSKGTLFIYFAGKEELFKAVIRENISGKFAEWNEVFERFEGSSQQMLQTCLQSWWLRIGSTKAAGIPKLIMSEAHNFPELAVFYQQEVVQPGVVLIQRILQRGMERGEFRPIDPDYGAYMVLAPMLFLSTWSPALCHSGGQPLDPQRFLALQLDLLLHGLCIPPTSSAPSPPTPSPSP